MGNRNFCLEPFKKFNPNVIALTGGMGCGKSMVVSVFKELECHIIDTDCICNDLYKEELFRVKLMDRWKDRIISEGKIDKKKIASIVFNDPDEINFLNELTHPLIMQRVQVMVDTSEDIEKQKITIVDIPLLFESKLDIFFDVYIAVWCSKELQNQRLKTRNNWSKEEIEERLKNQMSSDRKLELASYGIINNGTIESLKKQCEIILYDILKRGTK